MLHFVIVTAAKFKYILLRSRSFMIKVIKNCFQFWESRVSFSLPDRFTGGESAEGLWILFVGVTSA